MTRPKTPGTYRRSCRTCGWSGAYTSAAKGDYAKRRHSCAANLAKAERAARHAALMDNVDRTPKICQHKKTTHQHGTYASYVLDGCRCLPCVDARGEYDRTSNRQKAYGRWNGLVDAEPARQHVLQLMAAGMGHKQVRTAAGISSGAMTKLLYGLKRPDGTRRPPAARIQPATANAILGVELQLAGGAKVDGQETARRIQALIACGWSGSQIASRLGLLRSNFTPLIHGRRDVLASTARAVHALYSELIDQRPPEATHRERIAASRARNMAKAHGWAPPLRIAGKAWIGTALPAADDITEIHELTARHLPYAPLGGYLATVDDWRLRVDETTEKAIDRARKDGRLTFKAADAIATALNLHLDLIWTPGDQEAAS